MVNHSRSRNELHRCNPSESTPKWRLFIFFCEKVDICGEFRVKWRDLQLLRGIGASFLRLLSHVFPER